MKQEFNHKKFGFKIKDLTIDDNSEPHCSLILKLNNIEQLNDDTFEITRHIPIGDNLTLLEELKKSCKTIIDKIKRIQLKKPN